MRVWQMRAYKKGFALPTVLIASVVMLMVLATAVSVTVSVRSALQDQYYNGLADAAANSGTAFAQACLDQNDNTVTWTDVKPLKPNTDCYGDAQSGVSPYVSESGEYRTYFVVNEPEVDSSSNPVAASAQGFVEILRESTGIAWRVFSSDTVSALAVAGDGNPVGTSIEGYWTTAPEGYLLENGQAVSRTTYADLFATIGTTYGAGDGSTTFNVPDSRGRVGVVKSSDAEFDTLGEKGGEKTHTLTVTEMPSHNHTSGTRTTSTGSYTTGTGIPPHNGAPVGTLEGALSSTYAGGNGAHNNLQPYIVMNRAIKY